MLGGIAQEPGVGEIVHELGVDAGGLEQLVVVVGGLLGTDEEPGERTGVVAVEERADGRQAEAA